VRAPQENVEVLVPQAIKKPLYEGPLTVLVDRDSASASELLAAALQDHRRAVVVGGEQTFGKGTVQATFQLGEYLSARFRNPVGGLLVTLGKFYRVSGHSTQLTGVKPDVVLPSTLDLPAHGEAALGNPLPNDFLSPVWGKSQGTVTEDGIKELRKRSAQRLSGSESFRQIAMERERLRREWQQNRVSLCEAERLFQHRGEQMEYAARQREMGGMPEDRIFAPVRLEDLGLKTLNRSKVDLFRSPDPEWSAWEEETLCVMRDFMQLCKKGGSGLGKNRER
jgi:carboxyl-terminal processing protease